MALIVVDGYMVRYPLGGMMSWILQYLVGLVRLGHDVYYVEKSGHRQACFDPSKAAMTDDCSAGAAALDQLLARFGLAHRWSFVDADGDFHGLERRQVDALMRAADVYIELGIQDGWVEESQRAELRVLVDGDPGFRQIWMEKARVAGDDQPLYDAYYTTGRNVGTAASTLPTAGVEWRPIFHPVVVDAFSGRAAPRDAPFTTVMNWRSYESHEYKGLTYGQKDVSLEPFIDLPRRSRVGLELAVSGHEVPRARLKRHGWALRDAHEVTATFEGFRGYLGGSRGEFSVAKHGYVASGSGWFGDRAAAYLASGRPVIQQETGFSAHLPCGLGLFAVSNPDDAAAALDEVDGNYAVHARAARQIAVEHLAAERVLCTMLAELGV